MTDKIEDKIADMMLI